MSNKTRMMLFAVGFLFGKCYGDCNQAPHAEAQASGSSGYTLREVQALERIADRLSALDRIAIRLEHMDLRCR